MILMEFLFAPTVPSPPRPQNLHSMVPGAAVDVYKRQGQDSMISIQHLSKSFGDNEVLKDVNIEVAKGEVVVVLGPSGRCV